MLSQQLTLLLYDAKIQDDTATLLSLSKERNLKMKYSANKTSQVKAKYSVEEEQIQNKISEINKTRAENIKNGEDTDAAANQELLRQYEELKGELTEIKDKEDKEIERIETEATAYENENDTEQNRVQTDMQAAKEDREAIKENLNQDIESSFGYFQ